MPLELNDFDDARYLTQPEDQIALLQDAFESGDPSHIAHAIGVVTRAKNMANLASEVGVQRSSLYKAFSKSGNPRLSTFIKTLNSLGIKLEPKAI